MCCNHSELKCLERMCAMICNTFRPCRLLLAVLAVSSACLATAFQGPRSECYMLDKVNYLYDFTDWIGVPLKYEDEDGSKYTLRFCKDVQVSTRRDETIVNYGRFSPAYTSATSTSNYVIQVRGAFVGYWMYHLLLWVCSIICLLERALSGRRLKEYRFGDLKGCEKKGYDYSGRGSRVSIMCGPCPDSTPCKDEHGCVCFVKSDPSKCLIDILLGLNCVPRGPHVFSGFTVGFSPRGKEVVENGITQWGYDNLHTDYSFGTQQSRLVVYFTAQSTLASRIGKPEVKVFPEKGLKVQLSGTAIKGLPPTVESPTILEVDWRCEKEASVPYAVNVSIPVEGYDPIMFTLGKQCDYKDDVERSGSNGWATFGVLSFVLIVGLTMFCCAGFLYKSRIEDKHGLDALPGFSSFTSCIESASGDHSGYAPANDVTNITISRDGSSGGSGSQRLPRSSDGTSYGAV